MVQSEKIILDNGLEVLVHRDPHTPIAAMNLIYKVGSKDEDPRRTGFAHLFEHLMFGGSVHIPKYDIPLEHAGGENNAFTNADFTNYYLTLPRNNLQTAFWLESDRMLGLDFSQRSLDVQKQVVIEEFKQNYLNQPYGDVYLLLKPLAYEVHPYRWATIGKEVSHIEEATLDDVMNFYGRWYNPDNAILSVAGDVDAEKVFRLAEHWFGPIGGSTPARPPRPAEPMQQSARHQEVWRQVPQDALYMAWHMPARNENGYHATDLISDLLSSGQSSRLYQRLVKERKLFTSLQAFITGEIDGGLFIVSGKLMAGITPRQGEEAVWEALSEFMTVPVGAEELQKVKNKIEANLVFSRMTVLNKAMNLGYYAMLGDAEGWNRELEAYRSVNADEIMSRARSLFRREGLNTLYYNAQKS